MYVFVHQTIGKISFKNSFDSRNKSEISFFCPLIMGATEIYGINIGKISSSNEYITRV